jgi:anti-sigma factor RsiW
MNFPVQHLSDEAVAAYADGVLGRTARLRAERHLAECPECAYSVSVQREAVFALRGAPPPALPSGLLDRLRAVPVTTTLTSPPLALSPDGRAAFPAHGTAIAPRDDDAATMSAHPMGLTPSIAPRLRRLPRLGSVGMATVVAVAAVAALTAGLRASEGTGTAPGGAPAAPAELDRQSAPLIEPALLVAPTGLVSAPLDESARP